MAEENRVILTALTRNSSALLLALGLRLEVVRRGAAAAVVELPAEFPNPIEGPPWNDGRAGTLE